MHIYSRIQDAIIEHFNVFIQLSPCFLMHDGCVKRAVSTGWVASCHTSRPSSEGRATSFSWVHKRNGNMFVISESSALFVFFVNCAKKKTPHQTSLPASNSTCFLTLFHLVWSLQADGKCWCYLEFRLVSSLHLGSGHFWKVIFPSQKMGFPAVWGWN